jgi:hypothetical protein
MESCGDKPGFRAVPHMSPVEAKLLLQPLLLATTHVDPSDNILMLLANCIDTQQEMMKKMLGPLVIIGEPTQAVHIKLCKARALLQ